MTELSPAAQAVLDAYWKADPKSTEHTDAYEVAGVAAALRAVALEVVLPKYQFADWQMAHLIMQELQAIADELDG